MSGNLIDNDSIDENIRNLEETIEKPELWVIGSDEQIPADILVTGAEIEFLPTKGKTLIENHIGLSPFQGIKFLLFQYTPCIPCKPVL